MHRLAPLALLAALASCATPEERCIARATKDLRIVSALIAETEANLARGYAIQTYSDERLVMHLCAGDDDRSEICWIPETRTRTRPVAIDAAAERRKLADLRAKKEELDIVARREIAACRALAAG